MKVFKIVSYIIMVLWYLYYIYLMIRLYLNNSKPYYYDNIIDIKNVDMPLSDLSLIIYKKIKPELLTSTIVKLIDDKKIILNKANDDFILIKNCDDEDLSKADFNIIDLLFNTIGSDNKVSLKKIDSFCKNNSGSSSFLMSYQIWKKLVYVSSNHSKIFEPKLDYSKVKFIQRMGIILFILNILLKYYFIIGFFMIVPSIFITIYFYNISKLTKEYSDYYYSFLEIKERFSKEEKKELRENPNLLENNKYFEYSILLKSYDNVTNNNKKEFTKKLDIAIQKCYRSAILNGNRSLFH